MVVDSTVVLWKCDSTVVLWKFELYNKQLFWTNEHRDERLNPIRWPCFATVSILKYVLQHLTSNGGFHWMKWNFPIGKILPISSPDCCQVFATFTFMETKTILLGNWQEDTLPSNCICMYSETHYFAPLCL